MTFYNLEERAASALAAKKEELVLDFIHDLLDLHNWTLTPALRDEIQQNLMICTFRGSPDIAISYKNQMVRRLKVKMDWMV